MTWQPDKAPFNGALFIFALVKYLTLNISINRRSHMMRFTVTDSMIQTLRHNFVSKCTDFKGILAGKVVFAHHTAYTNNACLTRIKAKTMSSVTDFNSDEALLLRFQKNWDGSLLHEIHNRHEGALYNFLYGICSNAELCRDVMQDTWTKIITKLSEGSYQPHASAKFKTFLYTVARNRLYDILGSAAERTRADDPEGVILDSQTDETGSSDPVQIHDEGDRLKLYKEILSTLPDDQREVFELRMLEYDWDAIQEITGASREACRSRYRYAKNKLSKLIPK
jgi:RNA polymerase sigma factor (sigma-70 family)